MRDDMCVCAIMKIAKLTRVMGLGKNKEIIREAFETEIAKFEKRLDAYLKKYGTSKLRTWTYWQDE